MNLRELAEHLGLSQTTVSRALNGYPEVKEATRLRVQNAALALGYSANASARRLATGRAGTIGMLLTADQNLLLDPHFVEFLAGVGEHLGTKDIDLLVSVTKREGEREAYRRIVRDGRVDGIILSSPRIQDHRVEDLLDLKFPFVLHGRSESQSPYAFLDIDNEGAFAKATGYLLDLGHRRIALLNYSPDAMMFARHRELGYRQALSERDVVIDPQLLCDGDMSEENGFSFTQSLLDLSEPPTAILCSSTLMALGASRAIVSRGLTIGVDVSLIAHDDVLPFLKAEQMHPALTTTRSSIRQAGTEVSKMLLQHVRMPHEAPKRTVWSVELVVRDSTGPAPRR